MINCEKTININNNIKQKNDIFANDFNKIFNSKIPNIFRICYTEQINLKFPNICPYIINEENNITTYDFRSPKVISDENIKSIFYYGIESYNYNGETLKNEDNININLINKSLNLLKINNIYLNEFKYYIGNRYSVYSLLYQYIILTGIIFQNYSYNTNNKIICDYTIVWEYTYGCNIDGSVIKNYNNNWNTNQLLILHYLYTNLLNEGLDNYNITSTNMYDFMRIFKNLNIVLEDLFKEFNYKINKLCYCVPQYCYNQEEIKNLYDIYNINSENNKLSEIDNNYIVLNIYCYELNISHLIENMDPVLYNNNSIDGTENYTIDSIDVIKSDLYKYLFERNNDGELLYSLENNNINEEFPLFYYDNNILNNNKSKYKYNNYISQNLINGNVQFYKKNNLNINQQFIFNDYYYTSILIIINKNYFDEINSDQDILNETTFGQMLIDNFQTYYEQGIILIKSNNNYKTFNINKNDLIYENNIILCFIIKNSNILTINSIYNTTNQPINISKNYNINLYQTNNNLVFSNKNIINIIDYKNNLNINKLINKYNDIIEPYSINKNIKNQYTTSYKIQRFTNINEINYNYNLGVNINYTLKITLFTYALYKPNYINIYFYDNYTKTVLPVYEPFTTTIYNISPTIDGSDYYFYLNNNYIFPWYDILIIINSILI